MHGHVGIVCRDHGPGQGGDVLREAESVVGMVAQVPDSISFVPGSGGLGTVFNHLYAVFFGDGVDGIHVARGSVEMGRYHCFRSFGDGCAKGLLDRVHGFDVRCRRTPVCTRERHHGWDGEVSESWNDDFIALGDAQRFQQQVKPIASRGNHLRVRPRCILRTGAQTWKRLHRWVHLSVSSGQR